MTVSCPVCEGSVTLNDDLVEGELVECAECGTELEVKSVNPVTVEEAPAEQEDWGE